MKSFYFYRLFLESTLFGILAVLSACSAPSLIQKPFDPRFTPSAPPSAKGNPRPSVLTREFSWLRAHQIGQVSYVLWFGLDEEHEDFEGRAVVNFELRDLAKAQAPGEHSDITPDLYKQLKDIAQVIALDFEEGSIRTITVNGAALDLKELPGRHGSRYDGHRIYFHTSELAPSGVNRVEIGFSHPFAPDGYGFHRFKDPADGRVYVYTDFEPYAAHKLFPCFDQPDLKASFETTVEAPESWQVISNTPEREVTNVDGRKSWAFPPSPLISTYVFAIHAGPFQVWKQDANGTPMRLFARQSLKGAVDPKEWFDTTRKGLEYYGTLFGYPFPYSKYDQIIVPDFNAGAMENVAAVTFSERYVRRSVPTYEQRRDLANTILHEMAHQWFGDLVTMRWWSGLWLNESFASFMASKAVDEATDFTGSWADFQDTKSWAYWEDQLATTHPIEVPVSDTDQADTIFDGISYGKGASVLKQLLFYVGEDDFKEGLQRYFQKYALRNTVTHDLIKMLSEASGKDLTKWQKSWLQSSGVNGVTVDWACAPDDNEKKRIVRFNLVQSPAEGGGELRSHKTQIAFYDSSAAGENRLRLRKKEILTALYADGVTPVQEAIGKPCPDFVYPNHGDYDYALVSLDPLSLKAITRGDAISSLESALDRAMIWNNLNQMVVDGKMPAQDLINTIIAQADQEKNPALLNQLLSWVSEMPRSSSENLLRFLPEPMRQRELERIENYVFKNLRAPRADNAEQADRERAWLKAFLHLLQKPESLQFVRGLLDGKAKLPRFKLEQQDRWDMIQALALAGDQDAKERIDSELKRDNTDMGQKSAISAAASIPSLEAKLEWWVKLVAPIEDPKSALPIAQLRGAIASFYALRHQELVRPFVDRFFAELPKLSKMGDNPYVHYFAALFPALCEPRTVQLTTEALAANPDLPPTLLKELKIERQEEERCIRAQERALKF